MRGLIFFLVCFLLTSPSANAHLSTLQNNLDAEKQIASIKPQNEYLLKKELAAKNYTKAAKYLDEIIKNNPYNTKMLKLRADIAAKQKDFASAAMFMEKLKRVNQSTVSVPAVSNASILENDKLLASYYSQMQNYEMALKTIDDSLKTNIDNSELLELAIEYAMAQKEWNIALGYVKKALEKNPNSEKLLSIESTLYSHNNNCPEAISTCQKLAEIYSRESCKYESCESCDPCKIHKNLTESDSFMSRMYNLNPSDKAVLMDYNDGYSAQEKSKEAYDLIKKSGLEETLEGLRTQGDMAMLENDFEKARGFYNAALKLNYGEYIKSKIGTCYRKERKFTEAEKIYAEILEQNPKSEEARIGMAYIDIDKCKYDKAKDEFQKILSENPNSKDAKLGIVYTYMANNEKLKALELLKQMPDDGDEINYTKANIYYNLTMYSDAKEALQGMVQKNARNLKYEIKRARAFTVTPSYTFFNQELSEKYDLDLRKFGIGISEYGAKNTKAFMDYGLYVYLSGLHKEGHLTDVTNEIRGGVQGRPTEKFEYRADIGLKAYEFQGDMLNTDSWVRHYVNDYFNYKIGFRRNNTEQSYLAAVGFPVNGVFTGRVAENKGYMEAEGRLPNKYYYFLRAGGGTYNGQNLPTNPFFDDAIGLGKVIYNDPKNKWIQFITAELMNYNSSYQTNLVSIPDPNAINGTFGGYFSPSFYIAETASLKLEGEIKKWHLIYGLKGFVGGQVVFSPDFSSPVYGIFPFLSYKLNDHVAVNLSYSFSDYSGIQRHFAIISVNIKAFGGKKPSSVKH